jgi:hypothetical protein
MNILEYMRKICFKQDSSTTNTNKLGGISILFTYYTTVNIHESFNKPTLSSQHVLGTITSIFKNVSFLLRFLQT